MDAVKNFALATVSTGYDAAATSVVLTSGGGARLSKNRLATWWNSTDYASPDDDPNREIVLITAISTDTLTVTRAQEGTSASTKNTADKTYKIKQGITAGSWRQPLTGDTTFHVSPSGSDSTGDGSSGAPWRSPQFAYDWLVANIDFAGYTVTLQHATGTYTGTSHGITGEPAFDWLEDIVLYIRESWVGGGMLYLLGDATTPSNVVYNCNSGSGIIVEAPTVGHLFVRGLHGTNVGAGYHFIRCAQEGAAITVDDISAAGSTSGAFLYASDGGFIFCYEGSLTLSGSWENALVANSARLHFENSSLTLTSTPSFSDVFAAARYDSQLLWAGVTITGTATGVRFRTEGSMDVRDSSFNPLSLTALPGNAAGQFIGKGNYNRITRSQLPTILGTQASPITTNPRAITQTEAFGGLIFYGATGEIDLPAGVAGMNILIFNTGAFTITIDPDGSEVIVREGTAQSGGVSMTLSSGAGNFVALAFDGSRWVTFGFKGELAAGS